MALPFNLEYLKHLCKIDHCQKFVISDYDICNFANFWILSQYTCNWLIFGFWQNP
jgi:hypothetical protein